MPVIYIRERMAKLKQTLVCCSRISPTWRLPGAIYRLFSTTY